MIKYNNNYITFYENVYFLINILKILIRLF